MFNIVYIGDIIKKRVNVIKGLKDVKLIFLDSIDFLNNLNNESVDLFISNGGCVCDIIKNKNIYLNTPIITIFKNVKTIQEDCNTDLIITSNTSNIEFKKNIEILLKLKINNDKKIKELIINSLQNHFKGINSTKVYNAMNEGIIITDENGYIITINKTARLVCKYNDNKILVDDILHIFVNDIKIKIFLDTVNSKHKITLNSNTKLYTSDDKFIHISLNSSKLKDDNENFIGVLIIFQNITKEYNILSKLKDSEENYKRIYNNAPDIIYTHDVNGIFTSINRTSDFGYTNNEVIGHNIRDFMDSENLKIASNSIIHKLNNPNEVTEYEIDVMHKNGYPIRLEIKSILNKNKYGEYEIFSTARNITDKVVSRKQIQLEQERYKQMFFNNRSSVIVFGYNNYFHIIDHNNKGELIDIIKDIDYINCDITTLNSIFSDISNYIKIVYNDKRKSYKVDEFKFKYNNVEIYLSLFFYKLKHSEEVVLIYENITDIRLLLNQYEEAKNKAKESDNLKTMFLSNISHEIRTPMNAIKGYSSLLKENIDNIEKIKPYIGYIQESTDLLLLILNDILEISLIENGTIKINNDYFIIGTLLDDLKRETFALLKDYKKSYILLNIIEPFTQFEMCSDIRRIKQILLNIIDNAIKFTERGVIEISANIENEMVSFTIKDTGIGIRDEDVNKIFDRFYKVNNKKLNNGTGLGLAIAKELTNILGGVISVETTINVGSTFNVKLPLLSEKTINENIKNSNINWVNKKIMIVEDKNVNFRLLELYLEHTKVNIIRSIDGKDFYKNIDNSYDCILLDIQLPDTNGFELLKWIRKNNYTTPVIIQTAFSSTYDEENSKLYGANDYMIKPIKKNDLIEKLSKYLNS